MKKLFYIIPIMATLASCSTDKTVKSIYDENSKAFFISQIEKCYSNWENFSNFEKNQAIYNEAEVINDLDLYLIHLHSENHIDWSTRMENYRHWQQLTTAVERFLELKSTLQWYTHKTGTAGASFAPCGRRDMSIAHYLYNESKLKDPSGKEFSDELGLLGKSKLLSFDSIPEYKTQTNEKLQEYLNKYFSESKAHFEIADSYYPIEEKKKIEKIYAQWKQDTERAISDISELLTLNFSEYPNTNSNAKVNPTESWLYNQVLHILKYFD